MWTPATGNALHGLQARILVRALELVKVGGVVCYSTCSLNPVEDEAVVAAALQKVNKSRKEEKGDDEPVAELVNWPQALLPGFKRRPGVENWRVAFYEQDGSNDESDEDEGDGMNTNGDFGKLQYHRTYEDAMMAGIDCNNVERSLWPDFVENKSSLCLKRCSRLWPQDQDTGGFFVSLIRKNR
jgi:16S rRNA C967 or C1407 C5-methylase (RsmB/RsmF family)